MEKLPAEPNFSSPSTELHQNNNCDTSTLGNILGNIEPNFRSPPTPDEQRKLACKHENNCASPLLYPNKSVARPSVQSKFRSPPDPSSAYINTSYQKTINNLTHSGRSTLTKQKKNSSTHSNVQQKKNF